MYQYFLVGKKAPYLELCKDTFSNHKGLKFVLTLYNTFFHGEMTHLSGYHSYLLMAININIIGTSDAEYENISSKTKYKA